MWFISNNFASCSYRTHFQLRKFKVTGTSITCDGSEDVQHPQKTSKPIPFYTKDDFEFLLHCNNRFNSPTQNLLVRLQNSFARGVNKNESLPKDIVIILDDNVISFLHCHASGVAVIFGQILEWLMKELQTLLEDRRKLLPSCAKKDGEPCIYWCNAPLHSKFSPQRNELRKKWNACIETLCKTKDGMRYMRFKDHWNFNDANLVINDKMTEAGLDAYWNAVDSALQFNVGRHELFNAKSICAKANTAVNAVNAVSTGKKSTQPFAKQKGNTNLTNRSRHHDDYPQEDQML